MNKGNFLECLNLIKEIDPFLQNYKVPSNANYMSPSQNQIISCCAEEIIENITAEIRKSKIFAIMADEARDHGVEQLAVCVRYVNVDKE